MVSAAALCLRIYCDERRIGLVSPRRPANRKSDLESSRCEDISQEAPVPTYIVGDIHISDPAIYQARLPRALATNTPLWWARRRRCRRKIEMSPRAVRTKPAGPGNVVVKLVARLRVPVIFRNGNLPSFSPVLGNKFDTSTGIVLLGSA
jgi:hypothetical protein